MKKAFHRSLRLKSAALLVPLMGSTITNSNFAVAQSFERNVTRSDCAARNGHFTLTDTSGTDLGECFVPPQIPRGAGHRGSSLPKNELQIAAMLSALGQAAQQAKTTFDKLGQTSSDVRLSAEAQRCVDFLDGAKASAENISLSFPGPSDASELCAFSREKLTPFLAQYYTGLKDGPECGPFYEYTKYLLQMIKPYMKNAAAYSRNMCKMPRAGMR